MEYGLLVALISLASVSGIQRVGDALNDVFERAAGELAVADDAGSGSTSVGTASPNLTASKSWSNAVITVNRPVGTLTVTPVRASSSVDRELESYRSNLERFTYGRVKPTVCAKPPCSE